MTVPSVLPVAGVALLGLGVIIAVLGAWEEAHRSSLRLWSSYAGWADRGLGQLHSPLRPRDFFVRHLAAIAIGAVLGAQLGGSGLVLACAAAGALAPVVWMSRTVKRQRKLLEAQLDPALQTLANNLLATQNIVDGFAAVALHLPAPVSKEAELLVKDVKVGARVQEALANLSERCQSQHVDAVVTALSIGIRTGGDLGVVLKKIAHVVRETIRCEGMMASKTSEGKMSAWIIGAMPVVFGFVMYNLAPEFMEPLRSDPLGPFLIGIAAVLDLAGIMLVLKISRIDP